MVEVIIIIYFRTDANDIIATGHVMRCLTIADSFVKRGIKVTFIISDNESKKLISEAGYRIVVLNVDWKYIDASMEISILKSFGISSGVLFIDTYSATGEYTSIMKKLFNVVIIDDLFEQQYDADVLIDYNLYYKIFNYKEIYNNKKISLLLGGDYVRLRKQFQGINIDRSKVKISEKKNISILIICGGGDIYNTMSQILNYCIINDIHMFKKIEWNVVAGAYNRYMDILKQISFENDNVYIYNNINNMADLMSRCDICISAASTVLYECCVMQLPTVFYSIVDNQRYDIDSFSEENIMLYAGDFRENAYETLNNILINLKKIISDNKMYAYMVSRLKNIVNGNGADNIVSKIIQRLDLKADV